MRLTGLTRNVFPAILMSAIIFGAVVFTRPTVNAADPFISVINITGVPTSLTIGTALTLTGTVVPSDATNQSIQWSLKNPGTTGATLSGSTLSATAAGTVIVTATITNGADSDSINTIAAGYSHTLALKSDGSLWAWGNNNHGQLGDGTGTNKNTPVRVGTDSSWTAVSAGSEHTIGLKADGSLWTWGFNIFGQLGNGTNTYREAPFRIGTDTNWTAVSAGSYHTLALKSDGSLWAWGYNEFGQLGINSTADSNIPVQVGTDTNWAAISAGGYHTLALKSDGSLWAWGFNSSGQLGNGTNTDRITPVRIGTDADWSAISAGGSHSAALKSDGSLWVWGRNSSSQPGDDTLPDSPITPFQIGTATDWTAISAGSNHLLALKSDGSLWARGENNYGQLGDDTDTDRITLVRIGADADWSAIYTGRQHSLALKSDGSLWSWGDNYSGQLGDAANTKRTTPVSVKMDTSGDAVVDYTKDFSIKVNPAYGISLSPSGTANIGSIIVDSATPPVLSVTINNIGNNATGPLTIDLSGGTSAFTLEPPDTCGMPPCTVPSIPVSGNYSFNVVPVTSLTAGTYTDAVMVSGSNSISASLNVSFTLIELADIEITTPPAKRFYLEGDALDLTGITVTAIYSDGSTAIVTDFTTSPVAGLSLGTSGTQLVTISYTAGLVTRTDAFDITVFPAAGGGTITLPGGSVITVPDGSVINPDGSITLFSDGSVTILPVGPTIAIPGGTKIYPDGMIELPPGESAEVTSSDGAITITIAGNFWIDAEGIIILEPGATIETDNVIIELHSGGSISEDGGKFIIYDSGESIFEDGEFILFGAETFPFVFSQAEMGAVRLSAETQYLFVLVGAEGAKIIYQDGSTETVQGGAIIRINPDGDIVIFDNDTVLLASVTISVPPAKTNYIIGDTLDLAGMVVTATYSDGNVADVTDYYTSPAEYSILNVVGWQMINVSYTEDGITKSAGFSIFVNASEDGVTLTLPGGAEIDLPDGTVIDDDGYITLPPDIGGIITTPDGMEIEIPGGAVIAPDGAITPPRDGVIVVFSSDGKVKITIAGNITIEADGTITLGPGTTITTVDETEIFLNSGGALVEGDISFAPGMFDINDIIEEQLSEPDRYLFIRAGSDGAGIVYPDNFTITVPGDSVIRVNHDGSINIRGFEIITKCIVQRLFAGSRYFAPVDLHGTEYKYEITVRPNTFGGAAPIINIYGQFIFAPQIAPVNLSRDGEYIVQVFAADSDELIAIYRIIVT